MNQPGDGLAGAVQNVLNRVGEIPHGPIAAVFAAVGLMAMAASIRAALLCHPSCRRPWAAITTTLALWTAGYIGVLYGLPDWWITLVAHPLSLFCVGVGIFAFPGVRRSASGWAQVMLDGWMSVGGVATTAWIVLQPVMEAIGRSPSPGVLTWVVIDFAVGSMLAGLMVIAPRGARPAVGLVALGATLAGVGDLCLALTGGRAVTALIWIAVTGLLGLGALVGGPNLFLNAFASQAETRVITLSQLPVVPAVIFLFVPLQHDLVANLMAAMVVAVAFGNVAVHSTQNAALVDRVRQQRSQLEAVLTSSQDVIVQLGADGRIEFANPAATHVLGYPANELAGQPFRDLLHPDDREKVSAQWRPLREGGIDSVRIEFRLRHADGGYRFTESTVGRRNDQDGWVLSIRDTSAGVALRERLARQARTDPLTGLLNRSALRAAIGGQLRQRGEATLLFIDLDEFKTVNDTLGHGAGDGVLIQVAQRLRAAMGGDDGVARLGGDEFAVLVPPGDRRDPAAIAAGILDGLARIRTPEHLRAGHASIGIVSGPAASADDLLRDADLAMYQAKAAGGDTAVRFEPWMRERMIERSRLRAELETVIAGGGLSLALQPVVDLNTQGWRGFEALVRWPHEPSPRMPDEFLPLAEETGLIVPLGQWVLTTALQVLSNWDDAQLRTGRGPGPGQPLPSIAVNIAPRQLESDSFADQVLTALAQYDILPSRLILEITEQTAVHDFGSTVPRLATLRESGVHIAIDDFGTGYSSLRYLTRLPVDQLKIDKQFVAGLGVRSEDDVLVTSMLRLAAELGLDVVAEGVETPEQAQSLRTAGCELAQGYLFSRPIPMDTLIHSSAAGPASDRAGIVQQRTPVPLTRYHQDSG